MALSNPKSLNSSAVWFSVPCRFARVGRCLRNQRHLFFLIPLLFSCSGGTSSDSPAITAAELMQHVQVIAADSMDGRAAGSKGHELAAAYAAEDLRRAGVGPAWPHELGDSSFLGLVPLFRYRVGPGTGLEFRRAGEVEEIRHGQRSFELLYSPGPVSRPSAFEPPVFVGFAYQNEEMGWDDLDGLPLEGRLAVMMTGSPTPDLVPLLPELLPSGPTASATAEMAKLDRLAEEGVSAVLVVPEGWIIENWQDFWAMWRRVGVFPVETYTSQRRPLEPTLPVLVAHPDLVDRIFLDQSFHPISRAGKYRTFEIGDTDARIRLDVERIGLTSANVVGIVPGTDPILRAEYVVVSAHLDGQGRQGIRVYNSANDDASGCAAILELAEAVAASPLPRSVLFALFTAEEAGHLGSLHFLAHPPVPRDAITAVINVEQVGRVTPQARGFEAIGTEDLLPWIRRAGERIGTSLRVVSISESREAMQGSDAATFVGSGIPTVLLGGGGFPEYHSPADDPELIDSEHLLEATRILNALVEEMAGGQGGDN